MPFTQLATDMNIIQKLEDQPDMSAALFKAEFDKGCLAIKTFINSTLLAELGATGAASSLGIATIAGLTASTVQAALEALKTAIDSYVPDAGSITTAMLADDSVTAAKIADGAVGSAQIASGAVTPAGIGAASLDVNSKVSPSQASAHIISFSDTARTLALTDAGAWLHATSSSAVTITVPTNASVAFPAETEITIVRYGSGSVTFAAASGVTIHSAGSKVSIKDQYGAVTLKKAGTDTWLLAGDLS